MESSPQTPLQVAPVSVVVAAWSLGSRRVGTTERPHFHFSLSCVGEGNGNPLQCSCLENPRDRGAWRAAVYGVAQSRTWLKRLSSSITICKIDDQCKFNAWSRAPKDGPLGQHRGMGLGRRWERGSGWWDTCTSMADSFQCMAKPITIL